MATYAAYPPTTAPPRHATATTGLMLLQGVYYLGTGIWPLLSLESFQWVTGAKTDHWMVMTIGVLVAAIGLGLLVAGLRRRVSPEIVVIAVVAALGLTAIDVIYVTRGVLHPVYMIDAFAELVLIIGWLLSALRTSHGAVRLG